MPKAGDLILKARSSFVGEVGGETLYVSEGDLFEVDHPAVRKWPTMFVPVTFPYPVKRVVEPIIEQATAAPGEKRGK